MEKLTAINKLKQINLESITKGVLRGVVFGTITAIAHNTHGYELDMTFAIGSPVGVSLAEGLLYKHNKTDCLTKASIATTTSVITYLVLNTAINYFKR